MKHVFKMGGPRKTKDGTPYSIEAINDEKLGFYLSNGWFTRLEDIDCLEAEFTEVKTEVKAIPESGSDYEAELRAKIKDLGGKAGGRSSIETLESQLARLES